MGMQYTHATGAGYRSGSAERRQLIRAVVGSTIGTTVEWYDAILYGLLVPFYLGHLFFPAADPLASTLGGSLGLGYALASSPVSRLQWMERTLPAHTRGPGT